jgi:Amt family ammonium transporter
MHTARKSVATASPPDARSNIGSGSPPPGNALREFLDMLPCAAFIERSDQILPANPLARQIVGTSESLPVNKVFMRGYPAPGDGYRQRFEGLLQRAYGQPIQVSGAVQAFPVAGGRARLVLLLEGVERATGGSVANMGAAGGEVGASSGSEGANSYLQDLFDSSPESMIIVQGTRILSANREFLHMFGYSLAQCVGGDTHDLIIPDGRHHESEILLHTVLATGRASMETVRRTSKGEDLDVSVNLARVRLGKDSMGLCITFRDIRLQKQTEARLQHASLHDSLTGLPNRVLFLDRVTLTMSRLKRRPDRNFAVVFLDVDHFKQVNDTHGHAAGDALLLAVAARLRTTLRPQDTVARFGGDEFALLLDEVGSAEEIARLANRIQNELQKPVDIGGKEAFVSASMGIAISSMEYASADEIMHDADLAMYRAKAAGKARHEFFGGLAQPAIEEQSASSEEPIASSVEPEASAEESTARQIRWPASWE